MTSFIPKKNKPHHDLVMTPIPLAKEIIEHYNPTGRILDPCRGTGAFYNNFPKKETRLYCEISEGRDFYNFHEKVDWIITNPPWSDIKKFLIHSFTIADNICFLIPFNHFSTKHRLRLMIEANFGIKEFYGVSTPKTKTWPQSGFQLGSTHFLRGYKGPIIISGNYGT